MRQNNRLLYLSCRYVLLLLLLIGNGSVYAQIDKTIKGLVRDNTGQPIIGATISEKGTSHGTITDFDGNFILSNITAKSTINISYIGFNTQVFTVGEKEEFIITLIENTQELNEVVVVGYGVQRKSDLTGAVASVKASDVLNATPTSNIADALQGRMSGVSISSNGDPSKESTIRIRGINSITGGSSPLVVIDGFIGGTLNSLNPSDIQSIEVLKDASATAVYGSRGANGVILVTTKTPSKNKMTINFNAFVNFKTTISDPDILSTGDFAELANAYGKEYYESYGKPAVSYYTSEQIADFKSGKAGYNYIDHIFNNPAVNQNYELSVSNAGEKTSYLASISYKDTEGVIKNSKQKAVNYRLKVDSQLKSWMKMGINIWGLYNESSGPRMSQYEGLLMKAMTYPSTSMPYNEKNQYNNTLPISGAPSYNPMGLVNEIEMNNKRLTNHLQGYLNFNLLEGLTFRSQIGISFLNTLNTNTNNEASYSYFKNSQTDAKSSSNWQYSWLNTNTLNYVKEFNSDHRINATAVFEQSYNNDYNFAAEAYDLTFEQLGTDALNYSNLQKASSERMINTMLSGLFRVNYVFKNRYMLTASIRADGSSRLEEKWDYFPSMALAWNVKQEAFMADIDVISQFKLRAGYGSVGNQAIGAYRTVSKMESVVNADGSVSYVVGRPASPELKWEKNNQINIGTDIGLFNNRLTFNIDWYDKRSKDVLMEVEQPAHTGWDKLLKNACEIRNTGVEITMSADPYAKGDFNWHTDVTLSHNKGTFEKIPTPTKMQNVGDKFEDSVMKMIEGERLGSFWGYVNQGVWKTTDMDKEVTITKGGKQVTGTYSSIYKVVPGQERLEDRNMDGSYNDNDKTIIGNGQPLFNWGWNNSFNYKQFDFSLFIIGVHGFDIYNATKHFSYPNTSGIAGAVDNVTPNPEFLNRWTPENEDTDIPGFVHLTKSIKAYNSRFVSKGDFIKVKSITAGYTLPQEICKTLSINTLRVYASIQNPFVFTSYDGMDPEATMTYPLSSGVDWGAYPNGRNYLLGLNFSF